MDIDENNNSFNFNIDRLEILKETIIELKDNMELLDIDLQEALDRLNGKIAQIEENPMYNNDEHLKIMKNDLVTEIEAHKVLHDYKLDSLKKQLNLFKTMYSEVADKIVTVKCKDLKEELENLTCSKIYSNLTIDIVSSAHSLNKIMKENKNKDKYMSVTISDKKEPEYDMQLNEILYTTKFPIEFEEMEADNIPLYKHIGLKYDFSDDAKRYTSLKVFDDDNVNLKFRLGDLVNEDSDTFKPVELLRDAICNIKSRENKNEVQKVKRI